MSSSTSNGPANKGGTRGSSCSRKHIASRQTGSTPIPSALVSEGKPVARTWTHSSIQRSTRYTGSLEMHRRQVSLGLHWERNRHGP